MLIIVETGYGGCENSLYCLLISSVNLKLFWKQNLLLKAARCNHLGKGWKHSKSTPEGSERFQEQTFIVNVYNLSQVCITGLLSFIIYRISVVFNSPTITFASFKLKLYLFFAQVIPSHNPQVWKVCPPKSLPPRLRNQLLLLLCVSARDSL